MPRLAIQDEKLTFEEFKELELEAPAEERWELIGGYIFRMMTGGSAAHNEVVINISSRLAAHFRERAMPCRVYSENLKLELRALNLSVYPDILVRCGPRASDLAAVDDPSVIIEVHSPSTREKDRVEKMRAYQRIPSVEQYVMIEPKKPQVDVLRRRGTEWILETFDGKDDVIDFPGLEFKITLRDIYEGVVEVNL